MTTGLGYKGLKDMGEGVLAEAQGLRVYVKWAACVCVWERGEGGESSQCTGKFRLVKGLVEMRFFPLKATSL